MKKRFESISRSPGFSKKAEIFFQKILEKIPFELASEAKYSGNKEKFFFIEKSFFSVDFYIPSISLIVEFFGDYWHGNPKIYKHGDTILGNKKVEDIWEYDRHRIEKLKKVADHVMIVWELDILESIELITNKIIEIWNTNTLKMK